MLHVVFLFLRVAAGRDFLHCPSSRPQSMGSHYKSMVGFLPRHVCLVVMVLPSLLDSPGGFTSWIAHQRMLKLSTCCWVWAHFNLQHPIAAWPSRSSSTSNPVAEFKGNCLCPSPTLSLISTPCGGGVLVFSAKKTTFYLFLSLC